MVPKDDIKQYLGFQKPKPDSENAKHLKLTFTLTFVNDLYDYYVLIYCYKYEFKMHSSTIITLPAVKI